MTTPIWHLITDAARAAIANTWPYWAARYTRQLELRQLKK